MKLVLKPKKKNRLSKGCERITLQFRKYNEDGSYTMDEGKGTQTIHLKDCSLAEAYEIVKASLLSSRLIDEKIIVD